MKIFENFALLHKRQRQQALDFFRGFRCVLFPIFAFTSRLADMSAENIQHCLAQPFGIFR